MDVPTIVDLTDGGETPYGVIPANPLAGHQRSSSIMGIVVHHSGGDSLVASMTSGQGAGIQHGTGAQYYVDRDGTIYRYAADSDKVSNIRSPTSKFRTDRGQATNVLKNDNVIGIEVVSRDSDHFTQAQIQAVQSLTGYLVQEYPTISPSMIVGHGDLQGGAGGNKMPTEGTALALASRSAIVGHPIPPGLIPNGATAVGTELSVTPDAPEPMPYPAAMRRGSTPAENIQDTIDTVTASNMDWGQFTRDMGIQLPAPAPLVAPSQIQAVGQNANGGVSYGGPTSQTPVVFQEAERQFPQIKGLGVNAVLSPGRSNDYLEFWPAGEEGAPDFVRPSGLPINQPGVEIYRPDTRPIDIAGDIASHMMVNTDPVVGKSYSDFKDSLTADQKANLKEQYDYSVKNEGETRSYDQWEKLSGLPAYFRGYAFQQWDNTDGLYTPEQRDRMDAMMEYLRSPQVVIPPGEGPPQDTKVGRGGSKLFASTTDDLDQVVADAYAGILPPVNRIPPVNGTLLDIQDQRNGRDVIAVSGSTDIQRPVIPVSRDTRPVQITPVVLNPTPIASAAVPTTWTRPNSLSEALAGGSYSGVAQTFDRTFQAAVSDKFVKAAASGAATDAVLAVKDASEERSSVPTTPNTSTTWLPKDWGKPVNTNLQPSQPPTAKNDNVTSPAQSLIGQPNAPQKSQAQLVPTPVAPAPVEPTKVFRVPVVTEKKVTTTELNPDYVAWEKANPVAINKLQDIHDRNDDAGGVAAGAAIGGALGSKLAPVKYIPVTKVEKKTTYVPSSVNMGTQKTIGAYTVQQGDNLSTLAARNGISVETLRRANPNITDANLIYAGQRLTIPGKPAAATRQGGSTKASGAPVPAQSSSATKTPAFVDKATGRPLQPVQVRVYDNATGQFVTRTEYKPVGGYGSGSSSSNSGLTAPEQANANASALKGQREGHQFD